MKRADGRLVMLAASLICMSGGLAAVAGDRASRKESSTEFRKEMRLAAKLLKANRIDRGVEKLESIIERYPDDPRTPDAKKILRRYGVSGEVRVRLVDRKIFRERLKITEESILDRQEKILAGLRARFGKLKPVFSKHKLILVFYDSQKRFREAGGLVTSAGHFSLASADHREGSMLGKVSWHLPGYSRTAKDRATSIDRTLYHELTHYLNAIHFARFLPSLLDEGLATFMTSRLNTTYYQYYRITDRQRLESEARNALNLIADYKEFLRFLDSNRGFGRGDASLYRWYSLCYAVVDCLVDGEIRGKRGTLPKLLKSLETVSRTDAGGGKGREPKRVLAPRETARTLLERLIGKLYGARLEEFHKALAKRILAGYKQR